MNLDACVVCDGNAHPLYTPVGSDIGLEITLCENCGLVQSRRARDERQLMTQFASSGKQASGAFLSCDADYSPVRVGKNQMTTETVDLFRGELEGLLPGKVVLDSAAARGHFSVLAEQQFGAREVIAVEQDAYMLERWPTVTRTRVIQEDFRELAVSSGVDFVFACHTLEHYARPLEFFEAVKRALVDDGHILIDVPNLATVLNFPIVDEFFYDRHRLYFTPTTLCSLLEAQGFEVTRVEETVASIKVLARNRGPLREAVRRNQREVERSRELIDNYAGVIRENRARLGTLAERVKALASGRSFSVALGAGRQLDALVRYGGLDLAAFDVLVDNFLADATGKAFGRDIVKLRDLTPVPDAFVFAFVRTASRSVREIVSEWEPSATLRTFPEVLGSGQLGGMADGGR